MLALHKRLAALQTHIEITDRQMNRLVCTLYGLTEEEVRMVEEGDRGMQGH